MLRSDFGQGECLVLPASLESEINRVTLVPDLFSKNTGSPTFLLSIKEKTMTQFVSWCSAP